MVIRMNIPDDGLQVGVIGAAHALKGGVHVRAVGDLEPILKLKRLFLEVRGWLTVKRFELHNREIVVEFIGVASREAAEELRGQRVYALKSELPLEAGRFYYHDLIGLPVRDPNGLELGHIANVLDAGASDILEVARGSKAYLVPLQAPYVQVRDGFIEIEPIPGLLED